MRERLLGAFVALTLLTITLYGVPRALVRAEIVSERAQQDVTFDAAVAAEVLSARAQAGLPVEGADLSFLRDRGDQIVYVAEGDDPLVLLGPPLSALASGDALTATARLADGAVVEARRPRAVLRRDVVEELTPIVVNGLLSLGVAVLAGFLLSRRLARPFQELAHQASLLGEPGGADVVLPRQTVREAEAISTALRTSSARLALLLRREREFARNATHQLRTPLTGIRLRVEDVIRWPETPAPVREELDSVLSEVDRLSETVTDLLALAREERLRPVEDTLLSDVVAVLERRWSPLAATSGRSLRAQAPSTPVAMARGPVDQILDVLVDNALRHGSGAVTVTGEVDRSEVVLAVRDEGCLAAGESFTFARGASRRSSGGQGIGLALSAELARAMGGRLCVARREPTVLQLRLPRVTPAEPVAR